MNTQHIFDYKVWTGCITTLTSGFIGTNQKALQFIGIQFRIPTIHDLQYISLCFSVLVGMVTLGYTLHKWYLLRKK